MLVFVPFYHGYGFLLIQLGLYRNGVLIFLSSYEPKLFLTTIEKYKVNLVPLVPPILTFLAKHPMVEKYNLRSVREIMCGAAPIPKEVSFPPSS